MGRRIKKSKKIVIYIIISCIITCIFDFVIKPTYIIKIILKILLYLIFPLLLCKRRDKKQLKRMLFLKKTNLLKPMLLGVTFYMLILYLYFLFNESYNLNYIINKLYKTLMINQQNYIPIILYITVIKTFLEEFFFKAYSFLFLKKHVKKIYAYLLSSITFSLSYLSLIMNLLSTNTTIIFTICLIFIEIIFNYLNEKNNNIYNSWMSHIFIYLAINTIGLINLGLI